MFLNKTSEALLEIKFGMLGGGREQEATVFFFRVHETQYKKIKSVASETKYV